MDPLSISRTGIALHGIIALFFQAHFPAILKLHSPEWTGDWKLNGPPPPELSLLSRPAEEKNGGRV